MAISCFAVTFIIMVLLMFPPEGFRMSVNAIELDPTQLECTAKIQQLEQKITQITQEVAAIKSCSCSSPGTKAHTLIKSVTSKSIASNGPGKGTSQDPYKIANIQDLQKLRSIWKYNLGKYFIVTQNINLTSIANFTPLPPFEGILDGNNAKILHLKIDGTYLSSQRNTGLFETIAKTGQVKNLRLENVLVKGAQNVGGLAGEHSGRIDNSYVTGQVSGTNYYGSVGGLVGSSGSGSTITDCYATAKVSGIYSVGGLVGKLLEGTIHSSYATGTVSEIRNARGIEGAIGGLVGFLHGTIQSSYARGNVSGQTWIGGLVGLSNSGHNFKINNCYATGNVLGTQFTGGLVGENRLGGTITKCYAIGQVSGGGRTGGLVGKNTGRIDDSYATGQVSSTSQFVGGLVGISGSGSRITDSYATAKVSGVDSVGGLVGQLHKGTIQSSYATGTVSGMGNSRRIISDVGGLVGLLRGTIQSSYATGNVSGQHRIGGLVGRSNSGHHVKINNSYATGNVLGTWLTGGVVGENRLGGTITKCYAIGQVSGGSETGGLVGKNSGRIHNSYATGQVSGTHGLVGGLVGSSEKGTRITDSYATAKVSGINSVGGLVGKLLEGTIQSSYATGTVSGIGNSRRITDAIGGLVGHLYGTIQSSYATGNVSGQRRIGGLVGLSNSGHHITCKINNSYATGNVSGTEIIGGLVGENRGTITKCYAIGQVSGRNRLGGLVGENTGRIENSYGKQQLGTTNTLGAKTDTELKAPSTFSGWDTRLWKLIQNQYPKLKTLN